jgi:hypothetical protein
MLLIPILLVVHRTSSRMIPAFWYMILFYVLAKVAEFLDAPIFEIGEILSGHSLKHLFAAVAPAILLVAFNRSNEAAEDRPARL